MEGCKNCCRNFLFMIISAIFIGSVSAVLIAVLVIFKDILDIEQLKTYKLFFLIGAIVSCLLLMVSVILSFVNAKWAKTIVTIILVLFDLIILALAIIVFVFGSKVKTTIKDNWSTVNATVEKVLSCKGWETGLEDSCDTLIDKKFKSTWAGVVLIVLFVILLAFIVLFFYISCKKIEDGDDSADSQKGQFNTPLTYGW
jgi:CDP-diglyceride synthetase